MEKHSLEDILKAKKILGIESNATLKSIKEKYRKLAREFHPDKCGNDPKCAAKFREISTANKIIMHYIDNYSFSFDKNSILKYNPAALDKSRFTDDWNWGGREPE